MNKKLTKGDLISIFRRRKKVFFICFFSIFITSVVIALYLPPIYRSEVTVLFENQQIPEEYVRSTMTTFIEERMQMITQQIMTRSKLKTIIDKFELYPSIKTTDEALRQLRKDIAVKPISTSVSDERTGRVGYITIAFSISFRGNNQETVQRVTSRLADLYIQGDIQAREKLASTTKEFFQKELKNYRDQIISYEQKISKFKADHIEQLPGSIQIQLQTIASLENQINNIKRQIRALRQKKIYLESQIANIDPLMPVVTDEGKVSSNPKERLKSLQLELTKMKANLSDRHPDIKKIKSEIAELEAQVGKTDVSINKVKTLRQLKADLAQLSSEKGPKHPDVLKLSREVEILTQEIKDIQNIKALTVVSEQSPDNPAYMNLKAQILVAETEINGLLNELQENKLQLIDYRRKIEMAPLVEEEYNRLTLDYESAKRKYDDLMDKLLTAQISSEMDTTEHGERFRLVEPAPYPEIPFKPNRIAIILFGFVLGLGISLGIVALQESIDHSIKSSKDVEAIMGISVIGAVDLFETKKDKWMRISKRLVWTCVVLAFFTIGSVAVDRYVIPLENLWMNIEDRMEEMGVPINKQAD
jgi:uncharacterized protein involved in exopolysaccharide biosynthesis